MSMVRKSLLWTLTAALCLAMACGCGGLKRRDGGTYGGPAGTAPADRYLDFDDVLIPQGMERDKQRTFVFRIGALTAGVLVMTGKLPSDRLTAFFEANMSSDNWSMVTSFRSPRTLLLFEKETRWCMVTISEEDFDRNCLVEIWISPKSAQIDTGLTKP